MIALEQGEHVVRQVRKHWFIVFAEGLSIFFAAMLPLIAYPILLTFVPDSIAHLSRGMFMGLYPLWLLMLWLLFFFFWTDYYLDVLVITNHRIVDIEQKGFFNREVSTFRLENIQDITTDVSGMIPTFFDFGDVHVQTASNDREFIIKNAAFPATVKRVIMDAHDEVMTRPR